MPDYLLSLGNGRRGRQILGPKMDYRRWSTDIVTFHQRHVALTRRMDHVGAGV
jgi:hypothetical protein